MKKSFIVVVLFSFVFVSCGNNTKQSQGTTYAPQERTSSLSEAEREQALAEKRAIVDVETLVSPHSVRMTILPPALTEDITESVCESIIMQMLRIASANGIAGVNGSSPIAFAASLNPIERTVTGSAPQKMLIKYDLTYYVLNTQTWDVYASVATEIVGVGDSFEQAARAAIEEMKDSPKIQAMITQSEERIISWFETNKSVVERQVDLACGNKEYAYALALLHSVPEAATSCYKWACQKQEQVLAQFKAQVAHEELTAMKDAIAAAQSEYSPAVAAHLAMLPVGSPEAKEGKRLYDNYMAQVDKERLRKIDVEERRRQEEFELQKLQMKYEYEAAAQVSKNRSANSENSSSGTDFAGKAKSFFCGASIMSMIGHVLSRCLFIL